MTREEAREAVREAYDYGDPEYANEVIKALEQEPINNGWVPYSEREPEEEGRYLVCSELGAISLVGYYDGDFCTVRNDDIVAWMPMPLPPPYKAESEDKE